jgi:Zn finger protein HypA/HybF involved in hydrogenase expression
MGAQYSCGACGGTQKYAPKEGALVCEFCGSDEQIVSKPLALKHPYEAYDKHGETTPQSIEVHCQKCAGVLHFEPHSFAMDCPYCDTPMVLDPKRVIAIDGVIPCRITRQEAREAFSKWVKSRWFAPNAFLKYFRDNRILLGSYLPYWIYDSKTTTTYEGQRGDAYYVSVTRTVVEDGKSVEKEVQERRIDWSDVSGEVRVDFDDLVVVASQKLSYKILDKLEPWQLASVKGFDKRYLVGFESEEYTTPLQEGFERDAKRKMSPTIVSKIKRDIGGDEQRILASSTHYHEVKYHNLLLPIWSASFKWNKKLYDYAINAQTGEVVGERPYSIAKILFAVLGVSVTLLTIVYFQELKMWFSG